MKRKSVINLIMVIYVPCICLILSCSHDSKNSCSTCGVNPEGVKEIKLAFANKEDIKFNCNYYFSKHSESNPYQFGDCIMATGSFSKLNIEINRLIGEVISPYTIVLYFNKDLAKTTSYDLTNLRGISTYTYLNGRIFHRLFINSNSTFHEYPKYNAEVDEIMTKQILFILQNSFSIAPSAEKSFIIIANKAYMGKVHA